MLSPREMAYLVDVTPKWIHNAALRLKRPTRHSVKEAIRLALARRMHDEIGIPLPHAVQLADEAIHGDIDIPFVVSSSDGTVQLSVDVMRFLIAFNARLAWMRTQAPFPERGRKPGPPPNDPLSAARAYGLDLSLVRANLTRSPAERFRALDENALFLRQARESVQRKRRIGT